MVNCGRRCGHQRGRGLGDLRTLSQACGTMKSIATHDRPREKLEGLGPSGLGNNELLAVILDHGFCDASALDLSNAALPAV